MYVIFYGVLGAFGWAMMAIFMAITLTNTQTPPVVGLGSPMADSGILIPGMGVRPHLGTELSQIEFSLKSKEDYQKYVDNIDYVLKGIYRKFLKRLFS